MSVENSIESVTNEIMSALSTHDLSETEKQKVAAIVGQLLVTTVEQTTTNNLETTANCCGSELDLAHQIREEITRKKKLLISNLQALR